MTASTRFNFCIIAPMNVAIYGSCVSRDVLRVHPVAPVAAYAARSSWVSALTPPVAEPDADIGLASDFQARMVRDDFASTAPAALDAGDALLLDLTDERFGVIEYGGGFITPSNEFRRSAWNDVVVGRRIPFASDEHVALFRELAPRMKERLRGRRAWVLRARRTQARRPRSLSFMRGASSRNRATCSSEAKGIRRPTTTSFHAERRNSLDGVMKPPPYSITPKRSSVRSSNRASPASSAAGAVDAKSSRTMRAWKSEASPMSASGSATGGVRAETQDDLAAYAATGATGWTRRTSRETHDP